jgi:Ca2+-binding RTX toxin-like protein
MAATEVLDYKRDAMKALLILVLLVGFTVLAGPAHAGPPLCFGKAPTIIGTRGDDLALSGASGNDVIWAKRGNDIVFGMGGDDRICGGRGSDELHGGYATGTGESEDNQDPNGADKLAGNEGRDPLLS